jgi:putative Mg2+ transporter-C (MgtC) family protein
MELELSFQLNLILRLLLAIVFGFVIGFERRKSGKATGTRTLSLVAFGAALFTIISIYGFPGGDPARVAAQIVTGIGFLGAGLIIFREKGHHLEGLTTAATLWAVAALGMALGAGFYLISIFGLVVVYLILTFFKILIPED